MSDAELTQAIRPVIELFERLDVMYYVGGSVASSVHGVARTTLDADLIAVLRLQHIDQLVAELSDEFYVGGPMIREAIDKQSCFNVIHLTTMFKVDVFIAKNRSFDQSALSRIRRDCLGKPGDELDVWVASAEDVILNKLEWYRKGDEVSERQWNDVLGVLHVQHAQLDDGYLRHWANELGVSDLLDRARHDAGMH